MKKFLALVLALVMTMSLVTISAGAEDFTDADKVTYAEAVDVMTAIGVVGGYADGSFNPTAGLTRGAAAKIICNMILGPTTADALNADAAPFSDVAVDNVFAGYIAYCVKEGIISGYADGTFKPAAPLTGYAFMKMLLGALGYDAAVEGYVGSNWSINVAKQALNIGLDNGLVSDFVGTKALTREEAALYAFNTLKAPMVEYKNKSTIAVGDITVTTSAEATKVQEGSWDYVVGGGDAYQNFCEEFFTKLKVTSPDDAFGRPSNTWYVKNTKVGTYAKEATLTYTGKVEGKTIWADLGEPSITASTTFATKMNGAAGSFVYTDIAKGQTGYGATCDGVVTEVFWDANAGTAGELDVVSYTYYLVQATEDYDADDENVTIALLGAPATTGTTLYSDDFAVVADVKEDDYLVVTVAYDGSSAYNVQSVAVPEMIENVVVSKARTNDYVVADGTTYKYNDVASATAGTLGKSLMSNKDAFSINKDGYNLYLDPNGFVIGIEGYDAGFNLDNYVFVKAVSDNGFDGIAKVMSMDGTTKTVVVDKHIAANGTETDIDASNEGTVTVGFYTFDTDSDGNYELTAVAAWGASAVAMQSSGTSAITNSVKPISSATGALADAKTVFIAKDKVYVGVKNAPTVTSGTVYFLANEDGRLVAVYSATAGATSAAAEDLVYVLGAPARMKDGDTNYYVYDVVINGEKTTLEANQNNKSVGLYKITNYTDGRADLGSVITSGDALVNYADPAASASAVEGTLAVGSNAYLLAEDAQFVTVEIATGTVKTISASAVETAVADGYNETYAIEVSGTDSNIALVYLVK